MEIITKDNKKIDVPEERILTVPEGLLGFEEYTKYALYESEFEPFLWLQSIENQKLAFLIIDPFLICSDYETDIDNFFWLRNFNFSQSFIINVSFII